MPKVSTHVCHAYTDAGRDRENRNKAALQNWVSGHEMLTEGISTEN